MISAVLISSRVGTHGMPKDTSYSQIPHSSDNGAAQSFYSERLAGAAGGFVHMLERKHPMNTETIEGNYTTTPGMNGPNGAAASAANVVQRVAQKAHDTVDKLEQSVTTGSEKVMTLQEEYGSYAREHIKAHPLSTVAGAFAIGLLLGKVLR